ncbi:hypothetical protein SERLADRAFT_405485 [Serpula lacrymans var. lacrymans S7.9]|uniref:Uncharacterized protein n=1 Tax=Serpula lacrymans var. lacrymans (strain S7.9) TaxID=578457 RepID=F8NIG0_SERL9|nr:uncharacterized protein SERLADRAFT_405485 [Serpula lacrymans var. lacrymans S7.9]EGO29509.1 hypothetical protein SERLADRAFT_405485 [Serpula lacrymans var. lacrymans S7.9]
MKAHAVITPELICMVFKQMGIYPLSLNIFIDNNFTPSHATSTSAHFPESYPNIATSSNKSYHPSNSSSKMDESAGRIRCSLSPLPSLLSHIAGLNLPGNFGQMYRPGPATAPSLSPSQLGQDILPSPTPSEAVHPHALSLSGRGHQRQYFTHSSSSSLRSLNMVLTDWQTLNLIEQDRAQLLAICQKLEEELDWVQAERDVANVQCTIISHVVEETHKQLGVVTKKRQQGTGKIKAQFVIHPALKVHFNQEKAEHSKKAKERAAKDAQKAEDEAVHTMRIHKDTVKEF